MDIESPMINTFGRSRSCSALIAMWGDRERIIRFSAAIEYFFILLVPLVNFGERFESPAKHCAAIFCPAHSFVRPLFPVPS